MTGNEQITEGEQLRLKCRADGPTMPTEIEWFINGKRIGREHEFLSISTQVSDIVFVISRIRQFAINKCQLQHHNIDQNDTYKFTNCHVLWMNKAVQCSV
jgi:hypothetical protein